MTMLPDHQRRHQGLLRLRVKLVDAPHLDLLRGDPGLAWRWLGVPPPRPPGLLERLFGRPRGWAPPDGDTVDLGPYWHGLYYAMTGLPHSAGLPIGHLYEGGEGLGPAPAGALPPRLLPPAAVRAWHAVLSGLEPEEIEAAYDPAEMTALAIYPGHWPDDPGLARLLARHYVQLSRLIARAADQGAGLVLALAP